jgi:hypothetical protein
MKELEAPFYPLTPNGPMKRDWAKLGKLLAMRWEGTTTDETTMTMGVVAICA